MRIEQILQQDKIDDSIMKQVILYKNEVFTYFDSGLTRHVFVNADKTRVIKLLKDNRGKDFNEEEVNIYKNANESLKKELAETSTSYDGFVVEQEFCNPIKFDERAMTIKQTLFATSCRNEVGWTADGRLVCFDLDEYKRY